MKSPFVLCSILVASLALAVPTKAFGKHKNSNCSSRGHYYSGCATRGYRPYCAPRTVVGFGFSPFINTGFYGSPGFYGGGGFYDPYPVRTVYRVVPSGYGYRGVASDALAVDVQRSLARRGFYRGQIDGDVGPGTRAAIRSYQYDRGLTVTGRIDGALVRSLGLS